MLRKYTLILAFFLSSAILAQNGNRIGFDTLVLAGKTHLNFHIIKGGDITILFESGGGMDISEWVDIAPLVAKTTTATVVCYDRAGFGKSDLPDEPQNMQIESDWLWKGLTKLGLNRNLILAGHSFGGWMIRMTASQHPDAVIGMLFIDPFTNEICELMGAETIDNFQKPGLAQVLGANQNDSYEKIFADAANNNNLTKLQKAGLRMAINSTKQKYDLMKSTRIPGNIPIKIITSGKQWLPDDFWTEWRAAHDKFAKSIPGAELIIADKSDHMISLRQPELIINAIVDIYKSIK